MSISRSCVGPSVRPQTSSEDPEPGGGGVIARDVETDTSWDVTGAARGGGLADRALTPLPHYNKLFWLSWALFKPGTRISPAA